MTENPAQGSLSPVQQPATITEPLPSPPTASSTNADPVTTSSASTAEDIEIVSVIVTGATTTPMEQQAATVDVVEAAAATCSLKRQRTSSLDDVQNTSSPAARGRRLEEVKAWVKAGDPATARARHPAYLRVKDGDSVQLVREQDRPGYPTAIRALTVGTTSVAESVGFVDQASAASLAPRLDKGDKVVSAVLAHLHTSSYVGRRLNIVLSTTDDE
jgi:hypothetical protein